MSELDVRALHERGVQSALLLHGIARSLEIYEVGDPVVLGLLEKLLASIRRFAKDVGEPLRLQVMGEELLINGRLMRLDEGRYRRCRNLAALLRAVDVGEFCFHQAATVDDVTSLARDLARSIVQKERLLREGAYGEISLRRSDSRTASALSTEPERSAIWLAASLTELIDGLILVHRQERAPSLLLLKRLLQRLVDAIAKDPGIFHSLSLMRSYERPLSDGRRQAAECLHALSLGVALSLSRADLIALGLASILRRLQKPSDDPYAAVLPLLRYRALGELAPKVCLCVRDAAFAARGEEAGLLGQIMHLVTVFEQRLEQFSTWEVMTSFHQDGLLGVRPDLMAAFVASRGRYPLGTPVRLRSGCIAVVLGWDAKAGLPIVAPLDTEAVFVEGVPARGAKHAIVEAVDPHAVGFDLSRVRKKQRIWSGEERRERRAASRAIQWTAAEVLPDPSNSDYRVATLPDWVTVLAEDGAGLIEEDAASTSIEILDSSASVSMSMEQSVDLGLGGERRGR